MTRPGRSNRSAGILLFRRRSSRGIELLLVHPGGPYWARRDAGAWSIPKGEYAAGDDPLETALRELEEETGHRLEPGSELLDLGSVRQTGGKRVTAWAVQSDFDLTSLRSNTFSMEWPRASGRRCEFPEVDRAGWFAPAEARTKLLDAQVPLVDRLLGLLGEGA